MGAVKAQHSSAHPEHYTPKWLVQPAHDVLGGIDLDPASCVLGQEVVQARRYFSSSERGEDGLILPWTVDDVVAERVFVNPPGGLSGRLTKAFWRRVITHHDENPDSVTVIVGFSLEQILSWTKTARLGPMSFPVIIPTKRVPYDTAGIDGVPIMDVLRNENPDLSTPELKRLFSNRLERARLENRLGRAPGKSPPHGSMIVIVSKPGVVAASLVATYRKACVDEQGTEPVVLIPGLDTTMISWDDLS
jgi:hypothetical protein